MVWSVVVLGAAFVSACEPGSLEPDAEVSSASSPVGPTAGPRIESEAPPVAEPRPGEVTVRHDSTPASESGRGLAGPPTGLTPPAPDEVTLRGTVAERLPAGGYTYFRVKPESGEPRWVVTLRRGVETGTQVEIDNIGSRQDFYSRRLDRSFDELVFGVVRVIG